MKLTRTLLAAALGSAMALSLAACNQSGSQGQAAANKTQAAPTSSVAPATTPVAPAMTGSTTQPSSNSTAMPAANGSTASAQGAAATNWFGGPIYHGAPTLKATAALVKAGGGAENFSFAKALVSMLGQKTVNAEVAKLDKQYGKEAVKHFIAGMDFAVKDGLKRATEAGVKLPAAPADLKGKALAKGLVSAGTTPDGTFWAGYLFDHALSHKLHNQVMADIDAKYGHAADQNTHKILNQAMYDVAQAFGMHNVKLASLH